MEAIGILFMTLMLAWGMGVIAVQVAETDNKKKAVIELLICTVIALLLASPLVILIYNDVQQQKIEHETNKKNSPVKKGFARERDRDSDFNTNG